MTETLQVDTGEVRRVGSSFTTAGETMAGLQADAPLGDAAAAVPELQTAGACSAAKATVSEEIAKIASAAKDYGSNLATTADQYDATDQQGGSNIGGVDIPPPAPR